MAVETLPEAPTFIERLLNMGFTIPQARLVAILSEEPDRVYPPDLLYREIYRTEKGERHHQEISLTVSRVRDILGDFSIETVHGKGYKLGEGLVERIMP